MGKLTVEKSTLGPSGKPKLQGEELARLKKELRERSKAKREQPLFRLREIGELAKLGSDNETRAPLFVSDVQHLVMYSQIGVHAPYTPNKWCQLEKANRLARTNVLVFENVTMDDYLGNESCFEFLSGSFDFQLEIVSSGVYKSDFLQDFLLVPVTNTQQKKYIHQFKSLSIAEAKSDEVFCIKSGGGVIEGKVKNGSVKKSKFELPSSDVFDRRLLLLSGWQLVEENFPLPIKGLEDKWPDYAKTKEKYQPVTPFSPMFGVDCEMCFTTSGTNELTRISIVNEKLEIVYETLVKPYNRITNYLTQYSGITKKMMKDVKKRLEQVQKDIQKLLPPDAILVGQSLNNDMHALKMMHPYVIDSSVVYNTTGQRHRKTKLKTLTEYFLKETIQDSKEGHCSSEDSIAALKLIQLKLANSLTFGDVVLSGVQEHLKILPDLGSVNFGTSMLKHATRSDKKVSIFADEEIMKKYNYFSAKNYDESIPNVTTTTVIKNKQIAKLLSQDTECSLNIGHFVIDRTKLEADPKKQCSRLNKWIEKVFVHSPDFSLNIVIFTGHSESNGCIFVHIKK